MSTTDTPTPSPYQHETTDSSPMNPTPSGTPETDAHELYCVKLGAGECSLWSPLARRLEKERDQLRAEVEAEKKRFADSCRQELIDLRAQLSRRDEAVKVAKEALREIFALGGSGAAQPALTIDELTKETNQ